jgi:hypothetical protein
LAHSPFKCRAAGKMQHGTTDRQAGEVHCGDPPRKESRVSARSVVSASGTAHSAPSVSRSSRRPAAARSGANAPSSSAALWHAPRPVNQRAVNKLCCGATLASGAVQRDARGRPAACSHPHRCPAGRWRRCPA